MDKYGILWVQQRKVVVLMKKITISVPDDFPLYLDLMSDYLGIPKSRLITRQLETYFNSLVDCDPDFLSYLQSIAAGSGA